MKKSLGKISANDVIDMRRFSYAEWSKHIFSEDPHLLFPNMHFPNREVEKEFLSNVKDFPEKDVKFILRAFLIKNNRLQADNENLKWLISQGKFELEEMLDKSEYYRRNLRMGEDVWEGLTWVLEFLPRNPNNAIRAIKLYVNANEQYMTDQQVTGLFDCISIIRGRYFDVTHQSEFLLQIDPLDFEQLVENLYKKMGYKTSLTPRSYDDGIDINIERKEVGQKEFSIVQCKRYKGNIGVSHLRELAGVVADKKSTKGILVTTSDFTPEAIKFAENNPSLETINFKALDRMCNMYFGSNWPENLDWIISPRRHKRVSNVKNS